MVLMKKLLCLYAVLLGALPLQITHAAPAAQSYVRYALLRSDTVLYDGDNEPLCTLPATYFVTLAELSDEKCFVSFEDIAGYVASDGIEQVDYEPVTKFPYRTARVANDGLSANLRSEPTTQSGRVLCALPDETVLSLYGPRDGEEVFTGAGTQWQYVKYASQEGDVFGYVYGAFLVCDALTPNVIEKMPPPSDPVTSGTSAFRFTDVTKIAFIAALCVPALIVTLVMFYRPESKRTPRHTRKE